MSAQEIQGTFFDLTPQKVPFKQWQIREGNRLYCNGVNQLGDTELLAHVVRDQHIAEELMRHFSSLENIADASIDELKQIDGVGNALAEVIITALEFGRRALRIRERDFDTAGNPEAIYDLFKNEMGMLYIALITSRRSVFRGRPPGLGGGINGCTNFHCSKRVFEKPPHRIISPVTLKQDVEP